MKVTIIENGKKRELSVLEPALISDLAFTHKLSVPMPCAGRGKCGKCRVVASGELSPVSEEEKKALSMEEMEKGVRLACMTRVLGDAEITITSEEGDKILVTGKMPKLNLDPIGEKFGISIDIGTTTLAAYLYDLKEGVLKTTASMANPQSVYGADVISRLQKSHEGLKEEIADTIRIGLNELIDDLVKSGGIERNDVDALVITGNTAMKYLLTGQAPESIIAMPFNPDRFFGEYVGAGDLNLNLSKDCKVYLTRSIAAYIGGDITMSSISGELHCRKEDKNPCLLLDIGTNGEMVLWTNKGNYGCSTAAGPVFEGAGIHMGMNARDGAISSIEYENGQIKCHVLGKTEAKGICGSGVIDAVAAMLEAGIVDETGYLCEDGHDFEDYIVEVDDKNAFKLPGTEVVITQEDIRQIQLAKAAICAGILTLLYKAEVKGNVDVKIAGGFGNHINIHSAERVGLIPAGFGVRAEFLGNAAGAGASAILLDKELLKESEAFSHQVEEVRLADDPFFINSYTEQMMFE